MSSEKLPMPAALVVANPWAKLRQVTAARIALGRAGGSLPTAPLLEFQLAHARARDAVHAAFEAGQTQRLMQERGHAVLRVHSRAPGRNEYLRRPDLGRRLDEASRGAITEFVARAGRDYDAVFVLGDGLSPLAIQCHADAVLEPVMHELTQRGWRLAPVIVAGQARVALADEIGALLGAEQAAILIGERPGLTAADSLGIYLTFAPSVGRTDAERNCLSNIRPEGLGYRDAAQALVRLMLRARRFRLTGVGLKDDSGVNSLE